MTFSNHPWAGKQFDLPRSPSCLFLLPLIDHLLMTTTHSWHEFLDWSVFLFAVSTNSKTMHHRILKGTCFRCKHTCFPSWQFFLKDLRDLIQLLWASVASSVRGVDNSISARGMVERIWWRNVSDTPHAWLKRTCLPPQGFLQPRAWRRCTFQEPQDMTRPHAPTLPSWNSLFVFTGKGKHGTNTP